MTIWVVLLARRRGGDAASVAGRGPSAGPKETGVAWGTGFGAGTALPDDTALTGREALALTAGVALPDGTALAGRAALAPALGTALPDDTAPAGRAAPAPDAGTALPDDTALAGGATLAPEGARAAAVQGPGTGAGTGAGTGSVGSGGGGGEGAILMPLAARSAMIAWYALGFTHAQEQCIST